MKDISAEAVRFVVEIVVIVAYVTIMLVTYHQFPQASLPLAMLFVIGTMLMILFELYLRGKIVDFLLPVVFMVLLQGLGLLVVHGESPAFPMVSIQLLVLFLSFMSTGSDFLHSG